MNKTALVAYADSVVASVESVPATFYVPLYYSDATASEAAKAPLENDSYNVGVFARAYLYTQDTRYLAAAQAIVTRWTTGCKTVNNTDDTPLVVCYLSYKMFEAARLLLGVPAGRVMASALLSWYGLVLRVPVESIANNFNNWQSWSIFMQAQVYALQMAARFNLGLNPAPPVALTSRLKTHLSRSTWKLPLLSRAGEFWTENVRVNNSLRYTHFSLCPLLLASELLGTGVDFTDYIATFAGNCRNPSGYYARYGSGSLLGNVVGRFESSSATPELPDKTSWSGEFFFYVDKKYHPVPQFADLYGNTFVLGEGGELLYFVENDLDLGLI